MPAMRGLTRHFFTILWVLSLLLCVAVTVLWVRSYWWTDRIVYHRGDHARWLQSERGEILIQVQADSLALISADRSGRAASVRGYHDLRAISYAVPPNRIFLRQWGGFWWCTMRDPKQTL